MEYRTLGRTGIQVSALTFGSMLLHQVPDTADAARLLDVALDKGVNSLDTANVYGRGASEELLGTLLKACTVRPARFRSMNHSGRSTIWSGRERSAISAPAASPRGRSWNRCGCQKSCTWTGPWPNRRHIRWSIDESNGNCCQWPRATASGSPSGRHWPVDC